MTFCHDLFAGIRYPHYGYGKSTTIGEYIAKYVILGNSAAQIHEPRMWMLYVPLEKSIQKSIISNF